MSINRTAASRMRLLAPLLAASICVLVVSCARSDDSAQAPRLVKSIQHEAGEEAGKKVWLLAGTRGKIVLRRSCVQIESVMPDGLVLNSTIIFPENYFIEEDTRGWAIKNASGEVWATIGESKEISGGALEKPAMWQGAISTEDQRRCPGPYWLLTPPEALNQ